ncbi:hypothetical protein CORT_0F01870 [Candida orthopsilosis Co 90-125]|uniref:Uncharacterized protein n=1 Tax=Candida orthopsilosis (strain 90-125) TaxID=1136231 RepID=H8X8D9_CANO9|nr:hypothetical protein CORT_0F01870 [Candida orthopsilosis Co 90-125]CCG24414.1 hypothetical protein CORT_0F01870 [Candida orthopsilosis Co 90-125]
MGSSEDDEVLKILASVRIHKSIDDSQLRYLAQQEEKGYSERVIREVLNIIFELGRRSLSESVKLTLVKCCLNPSCDMSIQTLLNILANLGPTQNRAHGIKEIPSKKVSVELQVEVLSQIMKNLDFFVPTIQKYVSILLPILRKLLSYEFLRLYISSLLKFIFLQNPAAVGFCRNWKKPESLHFTRKWDYNLIKDLQIKFPTDPNLRELVEVIDAITNPNPPPFTLYTSVIETKTGVSCLRSLEENSKRRKIGPASKCNVTRNSGDVAISIGLPSGHQETLVKHMFAVQLCANKLNLVEVDNYFKITSFQDKDFCDHWIVRVLWCYRHFNKKDFFISSINEFVLNSNEDKDWPQLFHHRVNFIRLIKTNVSEMRSMIINDKKKLQTYHLQDPHLYSRLCEKYIMEFLSLFDVDFPGSFEFLEEITLILLDLSQFCPRIRSIMVRKILLLYKRLRVTDKSFYANLTLPRSVVYLMLLHGDLNLLDGICFHIAEEKRLHYTDDKLRRIQNSFTMDIVNMIWRGRFLSFDGRRDSSHKALFFNSCLLPKIRNSCLASIGIGDVGSILMSPVFVFIATKSVRRLEDQHNLDARIEGPLTEENIAFMQTDDRTQWLQLSRESIKLEVLRTLDSKGFTGVCDMLFKSLKSLSGARGRE